MAAAQGKIGRGVVANVGTFGKSIMSKRTSRVFLARSEDSYIGTALAPTGSIKNAFYIVVFCRLINALAKDINALIHLLKKMNQLLNKVNQAVDMTTADACSERARPKWDPSACTSIGDAACVVCRFYPLMTTKNDTSMMKNCRTRRRPAWLMASTLLRAWRYRAASPGVGLQRNAQPFSSSRLHHTPRQSCYGRTLAGGTRRTQPHLKHPSLHRRQR